jgi:hypothetical protein
MRSFTGTLAFFLLMACACSPKVDHADKQEEAVLLKDLEGKSYEFKCENPGRFSVVIMLLADCPACQAYSKTMNELSARFSASADFYGIFPGDYNTIEEKQNYRDSYKIRFPLYSDFGKVLVRRLKATVAPQAIVLDSEGNTIYSGRIDDWMYAPGKSSLRVDHRDLEDALSAAVSGRKILHPNTTPIGCIIE